MVASQPRPARTSACRSSLIPVALRTCLPQVRWSAFPSIWPRRGVVVYLMVLESLLGVAVAAADFRVGRGQVSSTHSGVSRRHTLPRRAVPGERARPRRHVIVAFGGSSPSAVCLLLTVSRAPGLVRLCRVAALYICAGARLRRGVSGARLSSDASPARGGARLLPPLGRTKGTVADQRTVVTGRPGGWRSTRAPATEGARSAASHPNTVDLLF